MLLERQIDFVGEPALKTNVARATVHDPRGDIRRFMADFSLETTPGAAAKTPDFRAMVRPGANVYITFLPGSDFADTIAVAVRLRREGFNPVPHIAARSIASKALLDTHLQQLADEAGLNQVLLIGGA